MVKAWGRLTRQIFCFGLGLLLTIWLGFGYSLSTEKAIAQSSTSSQSTLRVEEAAKKVYEKLPYLPLENQYIRQDTGKVDPEHTLISRFIRYHQDLKRRANRYRFDWRITLADYLGVNEIITADSYPGNVTLQINPMTTDVKAIQALNRRQRQELVDLLVQIYKIPGETQTKTPDKTPKKPTQPAVVDPTKPGLSQPGDSQLLKF
ncbi:MAG: hypothetical protein ACRC6M_00750 [Microcystaceae cyanobacterium]